jgi:ethanolamine transporter EutH
MNMRELNWKLILLLSSFGPIMGTTIVLGVLPRVTHGYVWLVFTIASAFLVAKRCEDNYFATGAVIGFLAGATSMLIRGLFVETFSSNNPWVMEELADKPEGYNLRYFVLNLVPFTGLAGALLGGMMAFVASRVTGRDAEKEA